MPTEEILSKDSIFERASIGSLFLEQLFRLSQMRIVPLCSKQAQLAMEAIYQS